MSLHAGGRRSDPPASCFLPGGNRGAASNRRPELRNRGGDRHGGLRSAAHGAAIRRWGRVAPAYRTPSGSPKAKTHHDPRHRTLPSRHGSRASAACGTFPGDAPRHVAGRRLRAAGRGGGFGRRDRGPRRPRPDLRRNGLDRRTRGSRRQRAGASARRQARRHRRRRRGGIVAAGAPVCAGPIRDRRITGSDLRRVGDRRQRTHSCARAGPTRRRPIDRRGNHDPRRRADRLCHQSRPVACQRRGGRDLRNERGRDQPRALAAGLSSGPVRERGGRGAERQDHRGRQCRTPGPAPPAARPIQPGRDRRRLLRHHRCRQPARRRHRSCTRRAARRQAGRRGRDGRCTPAAAGSCTTLWRFAVDGSVDHDFGIGGSVRSCAGAPSGANAVLQQPDGKLVAAGFGTDAGTGRRFAQITRFGADGSIDVAFGSSGSVRVADRSERPRSPRDRHPAGWTAGDRRLPVHVGTVRPRRLHGSRLRRQRHRAERHCDRGRPTARDPARRPDRRRRCDGGRRTSTRRWS